ncbi:uncharacterized protein LOC110846968 [Folsomia candida]|uniref:E3 ubiquitin-protein ligase ORTHRUS 1 n=1 Tax=Folsomia candida TaxID=158441 RepID=A0A226ENG0_FOLCA|nr:uncharacterized protein LOC110846968 [Folsomia candida]OXA58106.1 E3 ubiquitin-protein ligase ORTHRUS 1 [Folsomia candida]
MFLIQKYTQYKAAQAEQQKRKVTEKELAQLNHKIDKLLSKLDEHESETADTQDDECVVCVNAKATMQTYPCGHRVVCRKCFVKTIQMAVAQRLLPLRCVVCRAKILRLKHACTGPLPSSASQYTIGSQWYHVPSASLYSVSSTMSAVSGISGVSSASSCSSGSSYKTCASSFSSASLKKRSYTKQGYQPLRTSSPSPSRSPTRGSGISTKFTPPPPPSGKPKEEQTKCKSPENMDGSELPVTTTNNQNVTGKGKLSLIQEFQREFRNGKSKIANERKGSAGSQRSGSGSTRIKCARLLVNQAYPTHEFGAASDHGRSTLSMSKNYSGGGGNIGFRRATPPPTSQSCHSFRRLSRHDAVAPTTAVSSSSSFKKGSLRTIRDEDIQAKSDRPLALSKVDEVKMVNMKH